MLFSLTQEVKSSDNDTRIAISESSSESDDMTTCWSIAFHNSDSFGNLGYCQNHFVCIYHRILHTASVLCQRSVSDLTCILIPNTLYRSKINWIDILKLQMIGFDNESILDISNSFPDLLIIQLINNRATLTCAQVLTNTCLWCKFSYFFPRTFCVYPSRHACVLISTNLAIFTCTWC